MRSEYGTFTAVWTKLYFNYRLNFVPSANPPPKEMKIRSYIFNNHL